MSPRVSYWTTWLRPEMEGVSSEAFALARHFRGSWVFSLAPHQWARLSLSRRCAGTHVWAYPLFKLAAPCLERRFDITHIYGGFGDWFYLRNLGRRPLVLTAIGSGFARTDFADKLSAVVAQSPEQAEGLRAAGLAPDLVHTIAPGVDTGRFCPGAAPDGDGGFSVLFASSPERVEDCDRRGVWRLLDAAALLPDVRFVLAWRPWGNAFGVVQRRIQSAGLANVDLARGVVADMPALYRAAGCVVAPFGAHGGKFLPNSVIEGLACGRPAIVTRHVGLAGWVAEYGAGAVCDESPESLAACIETIRRNHAQTRAAARRLAEDRFDVRRTVAEYERLYESLGAPAHAT